MLTSSDSDALDQQYATDVFLKVRQEIHEHYSFPKVDFPAWVSARINWRGDEKVLDVGSGSGSYYDTLTAISPRITYYGLDRSEGMLTTHNATSRLIVGDAQHLPYANGMFDVVMANHMLFHVPDIDLALREIKRVLKPGGVIVTATNSVQTMREFLALFNRGLLLLSTPGNIHRRPIQPDAVRFSLESGTRQLARHFFAVVRHDLPGELVFPTVEPVMAYFESLRSIREPQLPRGVFWEDLMLIVREQISRAISHAGELHVEKLSGVLIATDNGDFIHDFITRRGGADGGAS
ncbi:MAG: class I SAM-dependent methyltransferase [Anaerolinea sp.]|nr:class I SAM-dependent methyltransferase [Anaerolinea sp.]